MEDVDPMEVTEVTNLVRDKGHPKYRGLAIIAIFHKFHRQQRLQNILYTEEDRKLLEIGFSKLQYGVVVWDEAMTKDTFFQLLKKVSRDPINNECETFALVIITHGNRNGALYAYDGPFSRQDVYDCFKAEECNKLKDKMKLLIFHACRGDKFGEGVQADGRTTSKTFRVDKLKDHIEINHLILCSTFEGHYAIGPEKSKGSFFIRNLCSIMEEEASRDESVRKHILALLTDVIRKTANEDIPVGGEIKKQQPALIMALHYLYHFKNKEDIPNECLQRLSLRKLLKSSSSAAAQEHKGSLFVQALNSVMVEEARRDESVRKHILALLTGVVRKTANVNINIEEIGEIKKQQPALIMALHYLYYFKNKEIIPNKFLQRLSFERLNASINLW